MKTKICKKCNKQKIIKNFCLDNSRNDKLTIYCIECIKIKHQINNNLYPWVKILYNIKYRCSNLKSKDYKDYGGRGIECRIIEEELKFLWFRDKAYEMKRPSIDRIDNDGHYELNNCRFIELSENSAERNRRVCSKKILQYDLNGKFIREWNSARDIERKFGFSHSNISKVCYNKVRQAYNYIWQFKNK